MIKAVLFDFDGTLVNSLADLTCSVNTAMSGLGFPQHSVEAVNGMVGNGIPKLIERALPPDNRDPETCERARELFMKHYQLHYMDKSYVYPGVKELLTALKAKGFKLAVISNKAQEMVELIAEKMLDGFFDLVVGKQTAYPAKPDPALTGKTMAALAVSPEECAFVGDSGMDMATAVNSGALPIGVLWGFRTVDELTAYGAVHTVERPDQIFDIVSGEPA